MNGFYPEGWNVGNKKYCYTLSQLSEAKNLKTVLESPVTMCDAAHNLVVDLGCMKGVIPRAEGAIGISDGTTRDIALISRVGKPVCFIIDNIETDKNGNPFALLSRKKAQELCRNSIMNSSHSGDIVEAKITHLESFGAFCDIGCGNIALLPIDSISVSRISHPKDRFYVGENIRAVIKSIADDGKIHRKRQNHPFPQGAFRHLGGKRRNVYRRADRYGSYQKCGKLRHFCRNNTQSCRSCRAETKRSRRSAGKRLYKEYNP